MAIKRELLRVLDSEWVQQKHDENGDETWGYELKEGAPEHIREAFEAFQKAQDVETLHHAELGLPE